jgi:hypothetical protein
LVKAAYWSLGFLGIRAHKNASCTAAADDVTATLPPGRHIDALRVVMGVVEPHSGSSASAITGDQWPDHIRLSDLEQRNQNRIVRAEELKN